MHRSQQKKDTELYDILGISPNASTDEIQSAYKKAALRTHPDKGGSEDEFKKVGKAKNILTNPELRERYDRFGIKDDNEQPPVPTHPGPDRFPFPFPNVNVPFDIGEMMKDLFGENKRGGGPTRQRGEKAPPKIERVPLSLSQFYHGHNFEIKFHRQKFCTTCTGTGFESKQSCATCKGSGSIASMIHMGPIAINSIGPCSVCSGEGQVGAGKCKGCSGAGKLGEDKVLNVNVKPGTATGEVLVFEGVCSDTHEYAKAGDVHIILEEAPDDDWIRSGDNLETTITLNLGESLVGTKVKFNEHPSGEPVTVEIAAGTVNGERLLFTGSGMRKLDGSGNGNLYVTVHVQPKPDEREKVKLEARAYLASLFGISMDNTLEV